MRKTNLIRGIICGLMLTTVLGSVVYAKTDTYSKYVGIDGKDRKTFTGTAGVYEAELRNTSKNGDFRVAATSTSKTQRIFTVEAVRTHYYAGKVYDRDVESEVIGKNRVIRAAIARNLWDEEFYDYRGTAKAYVNTFVYAGVSDNCTWTFYPRFN